MRAPAESVLDVLRSDAEYSFLVELIGIARLTDMFQQQNESSSSSSSSSSLTFFAPTNQVSRYNLRQ